MLSFFKKLENRPLHQRKAIALGVSVMITGFIFVVWASAFFAKIGVTEVVVTNQDIEAAKMASKETLSPFESMKQNIAGIGAAVGQLRNIFDAFSSVRIDRNVPPQSELPALISVETATDTPEEIPFLPPPEEVQE